MTARGDTPNRPSTFSAQVDLPAGDTDTNTVPACPTLGGRLWSLQQACHRTAGKRRGMQLLHVSLGVHIGFTLASAPQHCPSGLTCAGRLQATSRSGAMTARAATIAREIDADIAALRPRVSAAFRSFAGHDAALRRSIAAIPLPGESSVEESDTDSSRAPSSNGSPARGSPGHRCASPRLSGAKSAGSSRGASSQTASTCSGARSISLDQGPQDFSPLAAGAYGLQDDATSTPPPQVCGPATLQLPLPISAGL